MSDWNATGIDWNGGGKSGTVKFGGGDDSLLVLFYNRSVEIPSKSVEMGRRWCENQVFIKIQHPGENFNVIDRPATDADKMRFRRYWNLFMQNRTQVPEGTPIDLLFPNHPAVGENLRAMGVYTIEQCAKLSAIAIDGIGRGGQEYVNRAQAYLASADKGKSFHKMQKQLDEERTRNSVLEQQVASLKSTVDQLLMKTGNQPGMSLNPPFIPGFDAQSERINANHPTQEVAQQAKKRKKKREIVEEEPVDPITDPLHSMKSLSQEDLSNNKDIYDTEHQDAPV